MYGAIALPGSSDMKLVVQMYSRSLTGGRALDPRKGILACSTRGRTALTEPPLTKPVNTSTLSFLTSLVAAGTAVGGPSPSSATISSTSRPPSLLSCVSRYSSKPARNSVPTGL